MSPLLFAYGSNMAGEEVAGARLLGIARLPGFALEFRRRSVRWGGGAADIVEREGDEVWGVLYEVEEDTLAQIDAKEGAGFAYRRRSLEVESEEGPVAVIGYEVIEKEPDEVPPTRAYASLIVNAAESRKLPAEYVERLRRRLDSVP